jgi:hypothetical protein
MKAIGCSLFSGRYHYGVAALVNSAVKNGHKGVFWVGFQDDLPFWAKNKVDSNLELKVTEFSSIRFIKLPSGPFISTLKPLLILKVLASYKEQDLGVVYIDADSVVKCRWSFFEEWLDLGVGACIDGQYSLLDDSHPWRKSWREVANNLNLQCRPFNNYFCSAMLSVPKKDLAVLKNWERILDYVHTHNLSNKSDRTTAFATNDQDAWNTALMATDCPVSILGPDALDYGVFGSIISTAIGSDKPWDFSLLKSLRFRQKPSLVCKLFWKNSSFPISTYSPLYIKIKKLELHLATSILSLIKK